MKEIPGTTVDLLFFDNTQLEYLYFGIIITLKGAQTLINEASLEGRCLVLKRRIENGRGGLMKYSNDAVCEVQNSQTGIY